MLDTGDIPAIEPFVKKVISDHPEVDCLVRLSSPNDMWLSCSSLNRTHFFFRILKINNAGVQRPLDVNNFDLKKADQEIAINISGPMHLAMGFLDHFKVPH